MTMPDPNILTMILSDHGLRTAEVGTRPVRPRGSGAMGPVARCRHHAALRSRERAWGAALDGLAAIA